VRHGQHPSRVSVHTARWRCVPLNFILGGSFVLHLNLDSDLVCSCRCRTRSSSIAYAPPLQQHTLEQQQQQQQLKVRVLLPALTHMLPALPYACLEQLSGCWAMHTPRCRGPNQPHQQQQQQQQQGRTPASQQGQQQGRPPACQQGPGSGVLPTSYLLAASLTRPCPPPGRPPPGCPGACLGSCPMRHSCMPLPSALVTTPGVTPW
jgi:hypothetical protein